jgi:hypothetical protein
MLNFLSQSIFNWGIFLNQYVLILRCVSKIVGGLWFRRQISVLKLVRSVLFCLELLLLLSDDFSLLSQ